MLAVLEIDDNRPSITSIARSVGASPSSVGTVLSRLRTFLSSLDPEFKSRAFAALTNPRLDVRQSTSRPTERPADVLPFPHR